MASAVPARRPIARTQSNEPAPSSRSSASRKAASASSRSYSTRGGGWLNTAWVRVIAVGRAAFMRTSSQDSSRAIDRQPALQTGAQGADFAQEPEANLVILPLAGQPLAQWKVLGACFGKLAPPLLHRAVLQGTQVMDAVGQLDDPCVRGAVEEARQVVFLGQSRLLCDQLHQGTDPTAEDRLNVLPGEDIGVLHGVVQQRGDDDLMIEELVLQEHHTGRPRVVKI